MEFITLDDEIYDVGSPVFEIVLSALVDIWSTNELAYLWWSSIYCGGPKKYVNNRNDLIIISQGNATWNTTENLNH